jgi:hypothetical protein
MSILLVIGEVETVEEYDGYFFSVSAVITIAIPGSFCGLRNMTQIHHTSPELDFRRVSYYNEKSSYGNDSASEVGA